MIIRINNQEEFDYIDGKYCLNHFRQYSLTYKLISSIVQTSYNVNYFLIDTNSLNWMTTHHNYDGIIYKALSYDIDARCLLREEKLKKINGN